MPRTLPTNAQHYLLWAGPTEAGMMLWSCYESADGCSRAGGDRGCVAGPLFVWCTRPGCERCASQEIIPHSIQCASKYHVIVN